jgi:hypothetical protein
MYVGRLRQPSSPRILSTLYCVSRIVSNYSPLNSRQPGQAKCPPSDGSRTLYHSVSIYYWTLRTNPVFIFGHFSIFLVCIRLFRRLCRFSQAQFHTESLPGTYFGFCAVIDVREPKPVKQILYAGYRILHTVSCFNIMTNLPARKINVPVKMLPVRLAAFRSKTPPPISPPALSAIQVVSHSAAAY